MTTTPIISTLGNAALALSYYFISPKIKALTHVGLKTQMQAFGVSALVQACFQYLDEDPDKKSTLTENVIRYSLPFILIGGASVYTDKAAFKTNALVTTLLGISQLAIGHVTANAVNERINSKPFDADAWEKHYGKVEDVPKPDNIEEILNAPCPFWPGKKVRDTHMLTLIPATVDGKPFTLDLLSQLISEPKRWCKGQYVTGLSVHNTHNMPFIGVRGQLVGFGAVGEQPMDKAPYWVLMTKELVPSSKNKDYLGQQNLVKEYTKKSGVSYDCPQLLEAATCISTYRVRGGSVYNKESRFDWGSSNYTYTQCKENPNYKIGVGGFDSKVLPILIEPISEVDSSLSFNCFHGTSAIRRL